MRCWCLIWRVQLAWFRFSALVDAGTLGRVHVAEHVELVEAGEDDEEQVPGHQDPAVPLVQLPAIQVRRDDEEGHRGQQRKCRVRQPWIQIGLLVFENTM